MNNMDKQLDSQKTGFQKIDSQQVSTQVISLSPYRGILSLPFSLLLILFFSLVSHSYADPKKILIYGDSLSAAYNIPAKKSWVQLIRKPLKKAVGEITVVNASVSGETTAGGLRRLRKTLTQQKPDIMILELGANDGLRGMPIIAIKSNLSKMIKLAQDNQVDVILAGMLLPPNYGPAYTKKFKQLFPTLAKKHNIRLIPFFLEGVADKDKYKLSDGLHPNVKAQPIIMQTVLPYLVDALGG